MGLLLITHDLGVVAEMADEVGVMYAGRIVERAPVRALFAEPRHPYTWGLIRSAPTLDTPPSAKLDAIPGTVPSPGDLPQGCPFRPRCPEAHERCFKTPPSSNPPGPTAPGKSAAGLPKQGKCCRIRVQSYIECWQMRHGDGASPNMIIKELA